MSVHDWQAIGLSLQVAVLAATLSLPFAIAVAWWLARTEHPLRWLVETVVNLPLVLPPVVTGFLLLVLFSPLGPIGRLFQGVFEISIVLTWYAAVLAAAIVSFPLAVRAIQVAFQQSDRRLETAARTLGASRWTSFVRISLPLARTGVLAGWLLAFARSLGEFGATIMVAGNIAGETRTIPLAIYSHVNSAEGARYAWPLVVVSILLSCAALVIGGWIDRRGTSRKVTDGDAS